MTLMSSFSSYVMNFMLSSFIVVFSVKSARNLHISSILMIHFSLIGLSNVLKAYYLPLLLSEMYPSLRLKELITAFDVIFLFYFCYTLFHDGRMISIYYSSLLFLFTFSFKIFLLYFHLSVLIKLNSSLKIKLSSEGCNFSFVLLKHSNICLTIGRREGGNWLWL